MKQLKLDLIEEEKKTIVFDIETQRGFDETKHIKDMGVAAAVSYHIEADEYKIFTQDNVDELINEIFSADLVVGYNIIQFDFNVLKGYSDKIFDKLKTVDMMRHAEKQLGFRPKLNNLVECTIGKTKSADGLQSLIWYRQGEIDKVIEYCQQDVKVTKDLFEFGRNNGYVFANNRGKKVKLEIEW